MRLFALFVQTRKEEDIARHLSRLPNDIGVNPVIPRRECIFIKKGESIKEERVSFPGYIFLRTELPGIDFLKTPYYRLIRRIEGVYKVLNYGNYCDIEINEDESAVLWRLCDKGIIELSSGIIEDDKVRIISGPLVGNESIIRRIDRHRREAVVEILLFGRVHTVVVPLEIVKKI